LKANPLFNQIHRQYIWDPGYDHNAPRAKTMGAFIQSLNTDRQKIAVTLDKPSHKAFELFCRALWEKVLNGEHRVLIVVEEAAGIQSGIGKAGEYWGLLINQSRKFGGIILATSQRSQEIDKTILTQVQNLYVGCHARRDAKIISREIDVLETEIFSLPIGQFYHKQQGPNPARLIDFDATRNLKRTQGKAKKSPVSKKTAPRAPKFPAK
jgi:hypothetical protein